MTTPTLINLPPPPSDPATPSEMPGTPNSTTTSMSELSTVAIKDGHRGHPHHHHIHDKSTSHNLSSLDAERADRISRLAGLERVTTVRSTSHTSLPPGASASHPDGGGYFGTAIPLSRDKERSTVGSASATGSVGGRTTWASGSDAYDNATDDMETSSNGAMSEENGSLVGFGEGASSTVSGPVSTAPPGMRTPQRQSTGSRFAGVPPPPGYPAQIPRARDPRAPDYDYPDGEGAGATPPAGQFGGFQTAERIMTGGSFDDDDDEDDDVRMSEGGEQELGKFGFEDRR